MRKTENGYARISEGQPNDKFVPHLQPSCGPWRKRHPWE